VPEREVVDMMLLDILAAAAFLAFPAVAPTPPADEAAALAVINEQVIRAYVLQRDASGYQAHAHPRYKFIYAPGIIENLEIVVAGVDQVNLHSFELQTLSIDIVGDAAVIVSRVDAQGIVAGHQFPERVAMSHYWVRENGAWKLLAETMTPILVPDREFERMTQQALGRE
jgi:hypothetical protein